MSEFGVDAGAPRPSSIRAHNIESTNFAGSAPPSAQGGKRQAESSLYLPPIISSTKMLSSSPGSVDPRKLPENRPVPPWILEEQKIRNSVATIKSTKAEAYDPVTGEPLDWKKGNTEFTERMKRRHFDSLNAYQETIQGISEALEQKAHEASLFLQKQLLDFERKAEKRTKRLEANWHVLVDERERALLEEWSEVSRTLDQQHDVILKGAQAFMTIEGIRKRETEAAVQELYANLQRAAFVVQSEAARLVSEHVAVANELARRNTHAVSMLEDVLQQDNKRTVAALRKRWEDVLALWRVARHRRIHEQLAASLKDNFEYPTKVRSLFAALKTKQAELRKERMELLDELFAVDGFSDLSAHSGGNKKQSNDQQTQQKGLGMTQSAIATAKMGFSFQGHIVECLNKFLVLNERAHTELGACRDAIVREKTRLEADAKYRIDEVEEEMRTLDARQEWRVGEERLPDAEHPTPVFAQTADEFVQKTHRTAVGGYMARVQATADKALQKALACEDDMHAGSVRCCDFLLDLDRAVAALVHQVERRVTARVQHVDLLSLRNDQDVAQRKEAIEHQKRLVSEVPTDAELNALEEATFRMVDELEQAYREFASSFTAEHTQWPQELQSIFHGAVLQVAERFHLSSKEKMLEKLREEQERKQAELLAADPKAAKAKAKAGKGSAADSTPAEDESPEIPYPLFTDPSGRELFELLPLAELVGALVRSSLPTEEEDKERQQKERAAAAEAAGSASRPGSANEGGKSPNAAAKAKAKAKAAPAGKGKGAAPAADEPPPPPPEPLEPYLPEFVPGEPVIALTGLDVDWVVEMGTITRSRCFNGLCRLEDSLVTQATATAAVQKAQTAKQLETRLREHDNVKGQIKLEVIGPKRRQLRTHRSQLDGLFASIVEAVADDDAQVDTAAEGLNKDLTAVLEALSGLSTAAAKARDDDSEGSSLVVLQQIAAQAKEKVRSLVRASQRPLDLIRTHATRSIAQARQHAAGFFAKAESSGQYAIDELALFRQDLQSLEEGLDQKAAMRAALADELEARIAKQTDEALASTLAVVDTEIETLAVAEGLGQKHGAPRRAAQEAYHSLVGAYENAFQNLRLGCAQLARDAAQGYAAAAVAVLESADLAQSAIKAPPNPPDTHRIRLDPQFEPSALAARQSAFPSLLSLLDGGDKTSAAKQRSANTPPTAPGSSTAAGSGVSSRAMTPNATQLRKKSPLELTGLMGQLTDALQPLPQPTPSALSSPAIDIALRRSIVALAPPPDGTSIPPYQSPSVFLDVAPRICPFDPLRLLYKDGAQEVSQPLGSHLLGLGPAPVAVDSRQPSLQTLKTAKDEDTVIRCYDNPAYWTSKLSTVEETQLKDVAPPSSIAVPPPASDDRLAELATEAANAGTKGKPAAADPKKTAGKAQPVAATISGASSHGGAVQCAVEARIRLRLQAVSVVSSLLLLVERLNATQQFAPAGSANQKGGAAAGTAANRNKSPPPPAGGSKLPAGASSATLASKPAPLANWSQVLLSVPALTDAVPALGSAGEVSAPANVDDIFAHQLALTASAPPAWLTAASLLARRMAAQQAVQTDPLALPAHKVDETAEGAAVNDLVELLVRDGQLQQVQCQAARDQMLALIGTLSQNRVSFLSTVATIAQQASAKFAATGGKGQDALPPFMKRYLTHLEETSAARRCELIARARDLSVFLRSPRGPLAQAAVASFALVESTLLTDLRSRLRDTFDSFSSAVTDLTIRRTRNEQALANPQLSNPNHLTQLNALRDDEDDRAKQAFENVHRTQRAARRALCLSAARARVVFQSEFEVLLSLLDSLPLRDDFLPLPDEPLPPPPRASFKARFAALYANGNSASANSSASPTKPGSAAGAKRPLAGAAATKGATAAPTAATPVDASLCPFEWPGLDFTSLVLPEDQWTTEKEKEQQKAAQAAAEAAEATPVAGKSPTKASAVAAKKDKGASSSALEELPALPTSSPAVVSRHKSSLHKVLFKARNDHWQSFVDRWLAEAAARLKLVAEQALLERRRAEKWVKAVAKVAPRD